MPFVQVWLFENLYFVLFCFLPCSQLSLSFCKAPCFFLLPDLSLHTLFSLTNILLLLIPSVHILDCIFKIISSALASLAQ